MKVIYIGLVIVLQVLQGFTQDLKPLKWSFSVNECSETKFVLSLHANIEEGWYIYAEDLPEGGPLPLIISFDEKSASLPGDSLMSLYAPKSTHDEIFEMDVNYYEDSAVFNRKFVVQGNRIDMIVYTETQACYKKDGQCILITEETLIQTERKDGKWQIVDIKHLNQ